MFFKEIFLYILETSTSFIWPQMDGYSDINKDLCRYWNYPSLLSLSYCEIFKRPYSRCLLLKLAYYSVTDAQECSGYICKLWLWLKCSKHIWTTSKWSVKNCPRTQAVKNLVWVMFRCKNLKNIFKLELCQGRAVCFL